MNHSLLTIGAFMLQCFLYLQSLSQDHLAVSISQPVVPHPLHLSTPEPDRPEEKQQAAMLGQACMQGA